MAIRNMRFDGDEILRKISKPVKEITPRTKELIDDLSENLKEYNGVGLAAVQVGVLKRIAIVNVPSLDAEGNEVEGEDIIIINPEIEVMGEETQTGYEGCLSIPGKSGAVTRPMNIKLRAFDKELKPYELEASGLLARAICHECDHMDGILYKDKVDGELIDNEELYGDEEEDAE